MCDLERRNAAQEDDVEVFWSKMGGNLGSIGFVDSTGMQILTANFEPKVLSPAPLSEGRSPLTGGRLWESNKLLTSVEFLALSKMSAPDLAERTFLAIKPDAVQRGLVGEIIKRFEQKGFKLVALKMMVPQRPLLEEHYKDLNKKPFFAGLVTYMNSGPVVAMVWEGLNVVKTARVMLGETNPADSKPGTIRGDYSIQVGRNVTHGSDAVDSAKREIALWFKPEELATWESHSKNWIYE